MIFMSDLARAIDLPVDVDFMAVSSYGSATRTSGVVRIVKDLDADLAGRHVLVVEDIIDSGLTLNYLRRYLQARHPASLEVCALLGEGRASSGSRSTCATSASRSPPSSSSATASTSTSATGTSAPSTSTARPRGAEAGAVAVDIAPSGEGGRRDPRGHRGGPDRDGLVNTPGRVAAMYEELFAGLTDDPGRHLTVTFAADHDEMVMVRDIPFASLCEHHLVPFIGRAHVAYIPNSDGRITGISKLARLVEGYARRLQVQERMTTEIADAIEHGPRPPRRAGRGRGRAPLHVDAGGEEAGHPDGHLGGPGPVPRATRRPGPRPCSSSTGARNPRPTRRRPGPDRLALRSVEGAVARYPLVMGVLNVTPDSFFDGGRFLVRPRPSIAHGRELFADGRRHRRRGRRVHPPRRQPGGRGRGAAPGRAGRRGPGPARCRSRSTR